jgi:ribose transport system substrate-binding protein
MLNLERSLLIRMGLAVFLAMAALGTSSGQARAQQTPRTDWTIALSNGYFGNTWRHQMVKAFRDAAETAKSEGRIKSYVILNSDGTVSQQNSQLSDLILRHVDAIVVDASSETALNGVLQQACGRGIKVIAFDALASAPCAWQLGFNQGIWGAEEAQAAADTLHGKGNVLILRGVKGSAPDENAYNGMMSVLHKYPNMKIIGVLYDNASGPVAQSVVAAVIPTVSRIDAVLGQGGGDDIGIAQAFDQAGGQYKNNMPYISGAGSAEFIRWWNKQRQAYGYSTVSISNAPSTGGAAFWYALAILNGANPPKRQTLPLIEITNSEMPNYLQLGPGELVSPPYSEADVKKALLAGQ